IEAQFIEDLLDVTRIGRGKFEVRRTALDVNEVIRSAVAVARPDIEEKKQRLDQALEAPKSAISGDSTRLQQVFWNLLKNASKFTPNGGEIRLRTFNEPGRIVVQITDSGIGLDA